MAKVTTRLSRMRRLRHRVLTGLVRGAEGSVKNIPRLKRFEAWLADQAADLAATGTAQVFTADFTNDELDIAAHGHADGDGPFELTTTVTLPAGLALLTPYWVRSVLAGTLQVFLNREDAIRNVNAVAFTDAGTGVHTMTPGEDQDALVEHLRQGVSPERIQNITDIDDLI